MTTGQQDTSTQSDDSNTPPVWVQEPDDSDADPHSPTGHEEGEPMEEPGYGHGV
jgi:hypothetical protein